MDESAALHDQLLATKFFIPSSPHALVLRPRLLELLTKRSLECKLTLVSAPAGFGKTTLLSNWIHSLPAERARVAWVSLDEGDNEPVLFWRYVLTALDNALPRLCAELVTYLQTQQAPPLRSVLQTLLNRLVEQPEQFLLILDDYHMLTEQAIHTTLTYLVEHLPLQLRVILATRADPPLPFSLLRARGPLSFGELARSGGALDRIAKRHNPRPGQIALAWLLKRSSTMLPIPGTASVKHLEENTAGATIKLSQEEFDALDRAS